MKNRVHIEPAGLGAEERQTSAEGSGAGPESVAMRAYRQTLRDTVDIYGRVLTTEEILSGLEAVTREALEKE